LLHGSTEQLAWAPEIEAYGMEWADVYFGLRGAYDLEIHSGIPADVLSVNQAAMGQVSAMRWRKTRWCLVRVPNDAMAREAGCDMESVLDMFFRACLLDWKTVSRPWASLAERLDRAGQVRVVGKDTDLRFSVKGRRWMVGDGRWNMPDGEIATAPLTETVDGMIYFEFPGVLGGRLMHDIRLAWKDGRLVKAEASTNQDFLTAILGTDAGASLIGEFGIGTNPHIDRFSKDILLDEKIGGTVHIALGRAYPECGGTNESAIHWDIIKDTRREGAVFADGEPVLRNGRLVE
jgi:aminopeptidase